MVKTKEIKDEKPNSIAEALRKLRKSYGDDVVISADDGPARVESIPTGCFSLDRLLGCGGLPRGRIIEVFGREGSGKSTLCMFLVAQIQKAGGKCVYIDAENAFNSEFAKTIGVDINKLFISQPSTLEEGFDTIRAFAETNEIDLIVVDSVAAMVPRKELEGEEMLKEDVAVQARLIGKALRILTGPIARSKTVVVFINQTRDNIGQLGPFKTDTTPGGKALKFFSSVRLKVKRGHPPFKDGTAEIGTPIIIDAVKNKVGFPFKEAKFDLYYGRGVDLYTDAFEQGLELGVIVKEGNTYMLGGTKLAIGKEATIELMKKDESVFNNVRLTVQGAVDRERDSQ